MRVSLPIGLPTRNALEIILSYYKNVSIRAVTPYISITDHLKLTKHDWPFYNWLSLTLFHWLCILSDWSNNKLPCGSPLSWCTCPQISPVLAHCPAAMHHFLTLAPWRTLPSLFGLTPAKYQTNITLLKYTRKTL